MGPYFAHNKLSHLELLFLLCWSGGHHQPSYFPKHEPAR